MRFLSLIFLLLGSAGATCIPPLGEHYVKLSWIASPTPGVTSYLLYRSEVQGGPYSLIKKGILTTHFCDKTPVSGHTYFYVAVAKCPTCTPTKSPYSNEAQAVVP